MRNRPVFSVGLVPSTPMNEDSDATSGSSRMASASACWRCAIAAKDTDCGASLMPWMSPASCTGKKPLGTTRYSSTVSNSVANTLISVAGWRSSTQSSPRS